MNALQSVIRIMSDYEADLRDGFVSSTESWVESQCVKLGIFELKDEITKLVIKAISHGL